MVQPGVGRCALILRDKNQIHLPVTSVWSSSVLLTNAALGAVAPCGSNSCTGRLYKLRLHRGQVGHDDHNLCAAARAQEIPSRPEAAFPDAYRLRMPR